MTISTYGGKGGGVEELTAYLEDDFGDDALTGRSGVSTGPYQATTAGGTGDYLKGIYRPEWIENVGDVSVTSGTVVFSQDDRIQTPSNLIVGRWEFGYYFGSTSFSNSRQTFMLKDRGRNEFVKQYHLSGGGYNVVKYDGSTSTTVISGSASVHTSEATGAVTRDADGNYEQFHAGTSKGTATDAFLPTKVDTFELFSNATVNVYVTDVTLN